jgi:hypothetical protein
LLFCETCYSRAIEMRSMRDCQQRHPLNSLKKIVTRIERNVINKIECKAISFFSINIEAQR